MSLLDALSRVVLLPGGVVLAGRALGRVALPRSGRARDALVALAAGAGFVLSAQVLGVRPSLPLATSDAAWTWVVWLVPLGVLLGVAESLLPTCGAARGFVARGTTGAAAAWLLWRPLLPHASSPTEAAACVAVAGALTAGLWTVLRAAVARGARAALVGPVLVACLATAAVLLLVGRAAVLARSAVVLATLAAACLPWRPAPAAGLPAPLVPALVLGLVGLWTSAYGYLDLGAGVRFPAPVVLLLVASAGSAAARRWPWALASALAAAAAAGGLAWALDPARDAPRPW